MRIKEQETWTRAALAKIAGVGPETLRFYEQKGLLEKPSRNVSGYRLYGLDDLQRLRFISRSQELGFSLQDIKQLLDLTCDVRTPRKKLRSFAQARLAIIRQKLSDLKAMEKALSGLVTQCDGRGEIKGCPIADFIGGQKILNKKEKCHE